MASKKHFEAVARILNEEYKGASASLYSVVQELVVCRIANELADLFAKENERFDSERFLKACGIPQ